MHMYNTYIIGMSDFMRKTVNGAPQVDQIFETLEPVSLSFSNTYSKLTKICLIQDSYLMFGAFGHKNHDDKLEKPDK